MNPDGSPRSSTGPREAIPPIGNRRIFWASVVAGWILIGVGIVGMLLSARSTRPPRWSAMFVGAAIVHDFVIAPVVFLLAASLSRGLRPRYRGPVQGALVVTGLVAISTFPFVLRLGAQADNPTLLPNDYGPAIALVVAGIWAGTALILLRARRRTGEQGGARRER